jgi:cytochrome P450
VIPSEVNIRDIRQVPFEVDPPEHKGYRSLVEPWFKRPLEKWYQDKLNKIIGEVLEDSLQKDRVEVVHEFSLPIQSRALTVLLNTPYSEAETWISWGTHVFRSEGDPLDGSKANILYDYLDEKIAEARKNPGEDLYSMLIASEIDGRKLSDKEVKGVMMLTFAGGRDTVINALTNSIAYFSDHPESLERLRREPGIIDTAIEELIRYFAPLTQMGRVATEDTEICEHAIKKDNRISLCWASANRDAAVFENPNEVDLGRKMNPHVSFGFGTHNCLGATHARTIMKIFLGLLAERVKSMEIIDCEENIENLGTIQRKVGFRRLNVKFNRNQ